MFILQISNEFQGYLADPLRVLGYPLFTPFTPPLCHAIYSLAICRGFLGHLRCSFGGGNCGCLCEHCTCLNVNQMPCQHSWYAVQLVKNDTKRDKKGDIAKTWSHQLRTLICLIHFGGIGFEKTSFLAKTICRKLSMIIVEHVHCDQYHGIAFWWLSLTFFRVELIMTGFNYATNILWITCYLLCEKVLEQPPGAGGALDALMLLCDNCSWRGTWSKPGIRSSKISRYSRVQ